MSRREFGGSLFNHELSLRHSLFVQICLRLEPAWRRNVTYPGQDHFVFPCQRSMVER
ncbi:uncharacterized protein LACBIDRAFT_314602 [Laccaria bicolor S238N-H82]|uniref:Predicted protein n=1 Tax=Laccaria bicolor (strain S238N-H82 / ATCC MYA-4686) TaxID=486041 RepID=B0DYV9_LACBS|nr:uncharacterized protein LACBIDRAFT_314602 [Laccaria bicolor S238N-H82]EDR00236.1 predicted protein [Laccaria bicolor S238N-H82]|eukprot:XP_001889145.1 predicted protein [Laccaria bicolor S238N-H82]